MSLARTDLMTESSPSTLSGTASTTTAWDAAAVVAASARPAMLVDARGRIELVNQAAADRFALEPSDLRGRPISDALPGPLGLDIARAVAVATRSARPDHLAAPAIEVLPVDQSHRAIVAWPEPSPDAYALELAISQFEQTIGTMPLAVCLTDHRGRFLAANERWGELTGRSLAEIRRLGWPGIVHPEDLAVVWQRIRAGDFAGDNPNPTTVRLLRPDGGVRWVESHSVAYRQNGRLVGFIGTAHDITATRAVLSALQESDERFRALASAAPVGIFLTDATQRMVYGNAHLAEIFGVTVDRLLDWRWRTHIHPDDADIEIELADTLHSPGRTELRIVRPNGEQRWLSIQTAELPGARTEGAPVKVGTVEDVTERWRYEFELSYQQLHDPLTGLPNRALVVDRLGHAVNRVQRQQTTVAVLLFDLDRFKVVNDSLGHRAGDDLLVMAADRVRRMLRPGDTLGRLGGDEFVVICEDMPDERTAVGLAERLLGCFDQPFPIGDHEVHSTASIGIALATAPDDDAGTLLRDADVAMYRAKERGRRTYELFGTDLRERAMGRLSIEQALRRGLERGELRAYYQPIIDLTTGQIDGVEALVRWDRPDHGVVPPAEFIGIAEETGLIVPLGEWVLDEACQQVATWREELSRDLRVSVNLSALQLAHPQTPGVAEAAIQRTHLPPEALCLEVTETVLLEETAIHRSAIGSLQALGVDLAVDDFGVGYSSLLALKRMPVGTLKIDRAFVQGLTRDLQDDAIVAAVIQLGRALGIRVVAEGVETPEQLAFLRERGCTHAQGYLFSRPQPADVCGALIAAGNRW
jgi:diguanylate cyclase (GGDEF)-like protein/PAS domain S-box-containing protein